LQIFAAGSDLKAAVMSQYFGDLEYKASFRDLCHLLKITPDIAVCDMHPNYHSSRFAQHHHAHVASAALPLMERAWGGEFLICEGAEFFGR